MKKFHIDFFLICFKRYPSSHLECYRYFVIACQYICNRTINTNNLHVADSYLMKFCKRFEELYGPEKVTPNMHLYGHLKDCIMDMGPVYGFWLFLFERLVQILIVKILYKLYKSLTI